MIFFFAIRKEVTDKESTRRDRYGIEDASPIVDLARTMLGAVGK